MGLIKQGGIVLMKDCFLDSNEQIAITRLDGTFYNAIPKQQARFHFSDDLLEVRVYDALLDVEYLSKTNELQDGLGVISNVDAATDWAAVSAYLGAFVGKI